MRAPYSILRRAWLLACVLTALTAPCAEAGARAFLNLDGDGRRDELRIDRRDPSVVHVRLSASGGTTAIRTGRPVQRVIVVDLDGDRRPEIVARDQQSVLHVWTLDARGGYRAYRPWRAAPRKAPLPSNPGSLDDEGAAGDSVLKSDAHSPAPADAADASAVLREPARVRVPRRPVRRRPSVLTAPFAPRPPPALAA